MSIIDYFHPSRVLKTASCNLDESMGFLGAYERIQSSTKF